MTVVVWPRRRAAEPTGLGSTIVRLSTPATVSFIVVFAAGVAMAAMILDQSDQVFDSDWGRLLAARSTAVAIVAGLGAFNHCRLRPALEQRPEDPASGLLHSTSEPPDCVGGERRIIAPVEKTRAGAGWVGDSGHDGYPSCPFRGTHIAHAVEAARPLDIGTYASGWVRGNVRTDLDRLTDLGLR